MSSDASRPAQEDPRERDAEALFDRHFVSLYRFFKANAGSDAAAEALASAALRAARRHQDFVTTGDGRTDRLVFGIARGLLGSHTASRDAADPEPPTGHVRDEFLSVEQRENLAHVPLQQRMALELRYLVGLRADEAAAAMGRSTRTFRVLLGRAERTLRTETQRASDERETAANLTLAERSDPSPPGRSYRWERDESPGTAAP